MMSRLGDLGPWRRGENAQLTAEICATKGRAGGLQAPRRQRHAARQHTQVLSERPFLQKQTFPPLTLQMCFPGFKFPELMNGGKAVVIFVVVSDLGCFFKLPFPSVPGRIWSSDLARLPSLFH